MKINIKLVCRTNSTYKNGSAPIFIRLTRRKQVKYISTGVAIPPEYWDFENSIFTEDCPDRENLQGQIDSKMEALNRQIAKFDILEVEPKLEALTESKNNRLNPLIADCFEEHIALLRQNGKINTAIRYAFTLSSLKKFRPKTKLRDITPSFIQEFDRFLREQGNCNNSIATKMATLKALYNKVRNGKVPLLNENPFLNYRIGSLHTPTKKRAVTKDTIKKLIELELPESRSSYLAFARDIFLFSYYTAGMNFRDIAMLKYEHVENNRLRYRRRKTKKIINCTLIEPAQMIISKYGLENMECGQYIFPILDKTIHITEQQIHNRIQKVLRKVNSNLKEISLLLDITPHLTTYVARHTYATVLKRAGVNIAIISESMGHSDLTTTQIYLDSFENSQIDQAMENLK